MSALMPSHEKVTPRHQERWAYVYVRQSTPRQVREHRAGRENQYALVDRALALVVRQGFFGQLKALD